MAETKTMTMRKVASILISQPEPENRKSPYFDIAKRYDSRVDYRPFIHVEGVPAKDFRKSKINLLDFTSIVLTSRSAIDHYFRICEEMRVQMPQSTKYFCTSEAIALYLQKYIQYRKRRVFFGTGRQASLMDLIKKHKDESFLFPCSDVRKPDFPNFFEENGFSYSEAPIYRTVVSDLSDLTDIKYDMIMFFSPSGIKSLYENFPDFVQDKTRIAVFGPTTKKAAEEAGLRIDVHAPNPETPSMTVAVENYLKEANK